MTASEERDKRIAEFFQALTGLVKLCEPLVKATINAVLKREARRIH